MQTGSDSSTHTHAHVEEGAHRSEEEKRESSMRKEKRKSKTGRQGQRNKKEEREQEEDTTAVVSPARFVQVAKVLGEAYNTRRPMTSEGLILPFGRTSKGSRSSSNR